MDSSTGKNPHLDVETVLIGNYPIFKTAKTSHHSPVKLSKFHITTFMDFQRMN